MKKLLVFLMLGAGLVTVASANVPLDCRTDTTNNQCCVDVHSIQGGIHASPHNPHSITTTDHNYVVGIGEDLVNDAIAGGNCLDRASYLNLAGEWVVGYFDWQPGNWINTIVFDGNPPSDK